MEPLLEKGSTFKFSFKVKKLTGKIAVGICHSTVFDEKYEQEFNGSELGHGTYMLCSDGTVYNNLHKS